MGNGDNFRDQMLAAMARIGISPAELSRRTGVRKGIIYDLIRGKAQTTSAENARAIARELGFSLDTYVATERSAEADEIALIFSQLPTAYRDQLLAAARVFQRAAGNPEPPPAAPRSNDDPEPTG